MRWNEGCFDFVQINENFLRIVQVTKRTFAKSHSIELTYVGDVIDVLVQKGLIISVVDFAVVLPAHQVDNYNVCPINVNGEKWSWKLDLRKIGFNRFELTVG